MDRRIGIKKFDYRLKEREKDRRDILIGKHP